MHDILIPTPITVRGSTVTLDPTLRTVRLTEPHRLFSFTALVLPFYGRHTSKEHQHRLVRTFAQVAGRLEDVAFQLTAGPHPVYANPVVVQTDARNLVFDREVALLAETGDGTDLLFLECAGERLEWNRAPRPTLPAGDTEFRLTVAGTHSLGALYDDVTDVDLHAIFRLILVPESAIEKIEKEATN